MTFFEVKDTRQESLSKTEELNGTSTPEIGHTPAKSENRTHFFSPVRI